MQSVPHSCTPTFPSCHLCLLSGPTRAVLTHWAGKNLAWQQNKKIGSCRQSLGNFRVKAKEKVRPCRWDHRARRGPFVIWWLLGRPRGPWSLGQVQKVTALGDSLVRRERRAPARGDHSMVAALVGRDQLSLQWQRTLRGYRYLHWVIIVPPFLSLHSHLNKLFTTSRFRNYDSKKIPLTVNTVSQVTDSELA